MLVYCLAICCLFNKAGKEEIFLLIKRSLDARVGFVHADMNGWLVLAEILVERC